MKIGVIVYVVGDDIVENAVNLEDEVKELKLEADRVELVSQNSGHFDVLDACQNK